MTTTAETQYAEVLAEKLVSLGWTRLPGDGEGSLDLIAMAPDGKCWAFELSLGSGSLRFDAASKFESRVDEWVGVSGFPTTGLLATTRQISSRLRGLFATSAIELVEGNPDRPEELIERTVEVCITRQDRREAEGWAGDRNQLVASDLTRSLASLDQLIKYQSSQLGATHPATLRSRREVARTMSALGDRQGAIDQLQSLVEVQTAVLGATSSDVAETWRELAMFLSESGETQLALQTIDAALGQLDLPHAPLAAAALYESAASIHGRSGNLESAIEMQATALRMLRDAFGATESPTMEAAVRLAEYYERLGDHDSGKAVLEDVIQSSALLWGVESEEYRSARSTLLGRLEHRLALDVEPDQYADEANSVETLEGRIETLGRSKRDEATEQHPVRGWVKALPISLGRHRVAPWVVLISAFLVARVLSTALLFVSWHFTQGSWFAHYDGGADFWGFLQSWDVQWYHRVVTEGYPADLPLDSNGNVEQNTWVFLPVYPAIVSAVMTVGLPFDIAAMVVSIVFGLLATLALHRLLLQRFTDRQAVWGAVFFATGPLSWLLQVGYAESTYLFFLFCALAAYVSRRYVLMIPFALVASFTHPGTIALAAALALQGIFRLVRRQRILWEEWVTVGTAIVLITGAALFWPVLIAQITGDPSGYFDTELARWRQYLGDVLFVPGTPWFVLYGSEWGFAGILLVALIIGAAVFWFMRPSARRLGVDIWTFGIMYAAYLVATFLPTQALLRALLPLSPLLGHPGLSATSRRRWTVLIVGALPIQAYAIFWLWVVYPP